MNCGTLLELIVAWCMHSIATKVYRTAYNIILTIYLLIL